MKYIYIIIAILSITIISVFTFKEDLIYYNYAKYSVKVDEEKNNYFYIDNFMYVDNYSNIEIHNKEELYNSIYYIINSGITTTKRYFNIDYVDYQKDFTDLFQDSEKLNIINNFVHPYNVFSSIDASLDGYIMTINITYNDIYNYTNQELINKKIDNIINEYITNDMDTKEKIKIMHDYIINNTKYDQDFCVNEDTSKCKTTSIYKADNAYGVLFEHYGICQGYTDLMSIILNRLNITNYKMSNDSHTWNAVKIDDTWYILDVTWDDPISLDKDILTDTYFLITKEEDLNQEKSHIYNKEIFLEL